MATSVRHSLLTFIAIYLISGSLASALPSEDEISDIQNLFRLRIEIRPRTLGPLSEQLPDGLALDENTVDPPQGILPQDPQPAFLAQPPFLDQPGFPIRSLFPDDAPDVLQNEKLSGNIDNLDLTGPTDEAPCNQTSSLLMFRNMPSFPDITVFRHIVIFFSYVLAFYIVYFSVKWLFKLEMKLDLPTLGDRISENEFREGATKAKDSDSEDPPPPYSRLMEHSQSPGTPTRAQRMGLISLV